MNKIIKAFVVVFAVTLSFVNTSCDKFDTFPLNIPFSVTIITQSNNNNPSTSLCLSQSETYQNYVDDIEKLTFVEAAVRTDSVKNISTGTVKVTLKIVGGATGGATLFQKTLPGTNPSDYKSPNPPYVLTLTSTEIQALNDYLNSYLENPNQCLEASVEVTVTSGTIPYYLRCIIDIVVEAETKL